MLRLDIEIQGTTARDLEIAITEVTKRILEGYTSGHDENEDGSYRFETSGGQAGLPSTATMTVERLIGRLQRLRPGALVFVNVTTASGKEVIGNVDWVGNDMFKLVYLEGKEGKE